jgi:hypothetical protein
VSSTPKSKEAHGRLSVGFWFSIDIIGRLGYKFWSRFWKKGQNNLGVKNHESSGSDEAEESWSLCFCALTGSFKLLGCLLLIELIAGREEQPCRQAASRFT